MLSGDIAGRLRKASDLDASQEVTIRCGGETRKETVKYSGRLTRDGRKATLKLEGRVTPYPNDPCSVSLVLKLVGASGAPR